MANLTAEEFKSGRVGYEVLFVFIVGCIADMIIHRMNFTGLAPYYKSLNYPNLYFNENIISYILGAILGGLACVIALLGAKLLMYGKDELDTKNKL